MDAGQLSPGNGETSHTTAGREQQAVVRERAAVVETHFARRKVELLGATILRERHALLRVERRGPQIELRNVPPMRVYRWEKR